MWEAALFSKVTSKTLSKPQRGGHTVVHIIPAGGGTTESRWGGATERPCSDTNPYISESHKVMVWRNTLSNNMTPLATRFQALCNTCIDPLEVVTLFANIPAVLIECKGQSWEDTICRDDTSHTLILCNVADNIITHLPVNARYTYTIGKCKYVYSNDACKCAMNVIRERVNVCILTSTAWIDTRACQKNILDNAWYRLGFKYANSCIFGYLSSACLVAISEIVVTHYIYIDI